MTTIVEVTPQRSGWLRSALPSNRYDTISNDCHTDVIIVGAGYTGLNAAIRCNELGLKAVVLEAEDIGFGASGRNGGQVIPGLKQDPNEILRIFGETRGRLLVDFAGSVAERTFANIRKYNMQCAAQETGWLQPAIDTASLKRAHQRARVWQEYSGIAAKILDETETKKYTGSEFYIGGWVDPRGGQLQPLSYVRELARVAKDGGADIFVKSPVTRLSRQNSNWTAEACGYNVTAKSIMVCTNGYTGNLVPGLSQSLIPASSIISSTEPVSKEIRQAIMPSNLPISDARRLLNYMRFDAQDRFLIGARGSFGLNEPQNYFRRLKQSALSIFPILDGVKWQDDWGGRFALTTDHFPHLLNPDKGLYIAHGCNGRGIAMFSQLGRILADLVDGMPVENAPLPVIGVNPIPFHRLRRPGLEAVLLYYKILDATGI